MADGQCWFLGCQSILTTILDTVCQDRQMSTRLILCAAHRALCVDAYAVGFNIAITPAGTVWINTIQDFWYWGRQAA